MLNFRKTILNFPKTILNFQNSILNFKNTSELFDRKRNNLITSSGCISIRIQLIEE